MGELISDSSPDPPRPRRYDLDALRAFAMLLGIVLHAAIPFIPYWQDGDMGGGLLSGIFEFIHGFRMPLFFILSGYFTTMLWRERGLESPLIHRLRRVGLPLLIGLFTILPAMWFGWGLGWVIYEAGVPDKTEVRVKETIGIYDQNLGHVSEADGKQSDTDKPAKGGPSAEDNPEDELDFAHMWFLWFLIWLVAGFSIIARLITWIAIKIRRIRPVPSRVCTLALVTLPFLSIFPQVLMVGDVFGPDTSSSFQPNFIVLGYYGCFFGFGALAYDRQQKDGQGLIDSVGTGWAAQLLLASVVLFPVGRVLIDDSWVVSSLLQVTFAWTMSFGLIGLFLRYLSTPRFEVRWISDASYWMYLMHLPFIGLGQGIASHLPLNALVNFTLIVVAVTSVMLISYRHLVRYTLVGKLLNGSRTRDQDIAIRRDIDLARLTKG
jgi:peptidoglycan/LPS O-acetylase OafA/YrhL